MRQARNHRQRGLRARLVLHLVAIAVLAAACGSEPAAPERVTLRVLMADDWATASAVIDAIVEFEALNPGVHVEMRGVSFGAIPDAVTAAANAGEPIDVAHFHPFAESEHAQVIDDLWEAHLADVDYVPGAIGDVTWRGHRYGVPLDTNAAILIANRDHLEEVGAWPLPDPWTFEAFADVAKRVTDGDVRRALTIAGSNWTTYAWVRANGGDLLVDDVDGTEFLFDSPEVVGAISFLGDLIADGLAHPPIARDLSTDAVSLFTAGATTFLVTGSWDIAGLQQLGKGLGFEWEVVALPRGAGENTGTALGGSSLYIPKGAVHRDLAFAFMQHLTSDPYALRLAREEGRLPTRSSLLESDLFDDPAMAVVAEELRRASPLKLLAFRDVQDAFQAAFERVFVSRGDAAELLAEVQRIATAP